MFLVHNKCSINGNTFIILHIMSVSCCSSQLYHQNFTFQQKVVVDIIVPKYKPFHDTNDLLIVNIYGKSTFGVLIIMSSISITFSLLALTFVVFLFLFNDLFYTVSNLLFTPYDVHFGCYSGLVFMQLTDIIYSFPYLILLLSYLASSSCFFEAMFSYFLECTKGFKHCFLAPI